MLHLGYVQRKFYLNFDNYEQGLIQKSVVTDVLKITTEFWSLISDTQYYNKFYSEDKQSLVQN